MARIPETELERLKQEVSLQRLVEAKGVQLKRHGGKDLIAHCPFHDDKTPSFIVSPEKNLWHCLGACQTGGSVIDFVMRAEGVSFRHAVELLRNDAPTLATAVTGRVAKHSLVQKLDPVLTRDVEDDVLLQRVVDYYHATLKQSPEALAYLQSRGINNSEAVERFNLGYSNRTLGYRVPAKSCVDGVDIRSRLVKLGLLRDTGHELFRGSLVIPVLGEQGEVLEVYGRKIERAQRGTPSHLYLPGAHHGVWNIAALQATDEIILCEALIDALTFWCAGFRNVTASYGVEGFTPDHMEAFKRYSTKRVLIAYDRDEAGDKASELLAARLIGEGLDCYRVHFPLGMDANEYALAMPPATECLGAVLRGAAWMGQGRAKAVTLRTLALAVSAAESVSVSSEIAVVTAAPQQSMQSPSVKAEPIPSVLAAKKKTDILSAPEMPPCAPPQASPIGATPTAPMLEAEVSAEEVVVQLGDRRWRIRGLTRNMSYDQLKVNVLCGRREAYHVDTLDLYSARQRAAYLKQAADELGVEEGILKHDLGRILLKLEQLQDGQIKQALAPKKPGVEMSETETQAALELLRDPKLFDRILSDFERCGVVGEESNKLMGYVAAVSRKLSEPLGVIIQSSSAAGKTSLMEAVLAFMPEEERIKYSAMTGQSLFYMGETDLKHKILAIVEEEGAERASYALKLLQSEGELTIASTGKDPTSGRLITHEYRVEGPVMIFLTTTAVEIDEELLNRCIVLTVDEAREQTQAIHKLQRRRQTIEGLLERQDRDTVLDLHRNAQRLLKPILVSNPYAERLTFVDSRTRTRRDHMKYLTLLRTIAFLHQYQRPEKTIEHRGQTVRYIEVTLDDIAVGNRLTHQVLGRSLDELPPQTRRFLELVKQMVDDRAPKCGVGPHDYRFSRREVRQFTGWAQTQTRIHIERLVELEYVSVHRQALGQGQGQQYGLIYDGDFAAPGLHLSGLIDPKELLRVQNADTDVRTMRECRGEGGGLSEPYRADIGSLSGGCRSDKNAAQVHQIALGSESEHSESEKSTSGGAAILESYVSASHTRDESIPVAVGA